MKCKQIIKTGNAFNIINIKLIQHANKQFQLLASDIKGNVLLITLKEKSITDIFKGMKNIKGIKGSFEEKINKVFQCNPNTPYFLIDLLKFKEAEIAMFSPEEYTAYEESLHSLWDITNAMNDAESKGFNKGKKEGEKLGIVKTAIAMLKKGMSVELTAEISKLSVEEVEKIKATL